MNGNSIFDTAMQDTPEDIRARLANAGGLMEIPTENPLGQSVQRGDGWHYFGGIDGHPYRQKEAGAPPDIKDPEKELELRFIAKSRFFDMCDPDDLEAYQSVMTDCANGKSRFGESEKVKDESCGGLKIWVRWYEMIWHKQGKPVPAQGIPSKDRGGN